MQNPKHAKVMDFHCGNFILPGLEFNRVLFKEN